MEEIQLNSPITEQTQILCGFECEARRIMSCVVPVYTIEVYIHIHTYIISLGFLTNFRASNDKAPT